MSEIQLNNQLIRVLLKSAIRKELWYLQDLLDGPHYKGMILQVNTVKKVKANYIKLLSDVDKRKIGRIL